MEPDKPDTDHPSAAPQTAAFPPDDTGTSQAAPAAQSSPDADRQARIAYLQSLAPPPKPKKSWPKVVVIVVLVLLLAGAVAFIFLKKDSSKQHGQSSKSGTSSQTSSQQQANQTITTKYYQSTAFGLGFDYPDDWKVEEVEGKITATSKTMRLKGMTGETINSRAIVTIQAKQTTLKEFDRGNAVAVIDSEKITYIKPTPTQRAQTYLSFVDFPQSTGRGIDAIYITGDLGYQKDQAVPQVDVVRVDPLISVSFVQCPNSACSGGISPFTLDSTMWTDGSTGLAAAVKTVLATLAIQ